MNAEDVIGAVWSPDDGRVSPSDLCAALVKGARARGTRIHEDTAVTGILTETGWITAVETSRGTVRCDAIALCTGLWSRKVAAMAGVEVPVWPCEHFYLLTEPIDGIEGNVPSLSDHDGHLYVRDDSGGLLIGCFEPLGKPIDPERLGEDFAFQLLPEDWDHFEPMMKNALHRLPALETAGVRMLLNGPESFTPDGSFLLGEAAETRGLFLGCGMNSVGVATGGGAGMALAHCIVHGHPPMDLHEADPKRFPACFNSAAALVARVCCARAAARNRLCGIVWLDELSASPSSRSKSSFQLGRSVCVQHGCGRGVVRSRRHRIASSYASSSCASESLRTCRRIASSS